MEIDKFLGLGSPQKEAAKGVRISTEDKEHIGSLIDALFKIAQSKIKDQSTLKYVTILLFTIRGLLQA